MSNGKHNILRLKRPTMRLVLGVLLSFGLLCSAVTAAAAEAAATPEGKGKKDSVSGDSGSSMKNILSPGGKQSEGPLFIKSDNLNLDSKQRIFTYEGNVEVTRGDVRITADRVIGKYDDKNQIQTVVCENNVVLTRGEDMRAISNRAVYRLASATIILTEGPELAREGNVLAADKITVFVNEDKSEAEGNVRVKVVNSDETGLNGNSKAKLLGGDKVKDGK